MKILSFKTSQAYSLGVEFELQIVNPHTFSLEPGAKDLMRISKESNFQHRIKPEITQSMIEVNSSIHTSTKDLLTELLEIQEFLTHFGEKINLLIAGGGTHPFQRWAVQKIYPTMRYKKIIATLPLFI